MAAPLVTDFEARMAAKKKKEPLRYHLRPRNGWHVVRKLSLDEVTTEAGLVVNREQAKTYQAAIVALSKFDRNGKPVDDLNVGDRVMITAFASEFEDLEELTGEKDLLLVRDEEVYLLAVPKNE